MSSSKKGLKTLLVLGAAAVVLLLYIVQIEVPAQESKETGILVFPKVAVEEIESIAIKNQYGSFELRHSDNTSQRRPPLELVTLPGAMLSNQSITEMVAAIGQLALNDKIEEPESDLTAYGLNPAQIEVTIDVKDKEPRRILVGKENSFASKRYVKIGEDPNVYLLNDSFYSAIDLKEEGVRERKPIRFESYNVKSIEVEGEGTLTQDDNGIWSVTAPVPLKLDEGAVSKFLRALKDAEVDSFLVAQDLPKSYDKKITLHYKDDAVVTFNFNINGDSVLGVLSYEPLPFKFKKELGENLKNIIDGMRVKKPLDSVSADEIQKLAITQKTGDSFILIASTREVGAERKWKFEGADKNVDEVFVKQWISDINGTAVADYLVTSKDTGLSTPSRTLVVTTIKGDSIAVSIGAHTTKQEKAGYYASVSGFAGEVFILSEETVKKLFPSLESLEKKG